MIIITEFAIIESFSLSYESFRTPSSVPLGQGEEGKCLERANNRREARTTNEAQKKYVYVLTRWESWIGKSDPDGNGIRSHGSCYWIYSIFFTWFMDIIPCNYSIIMKVLTSVTDPNLQEEDPVKVLLEHGLINYWQINLSYRICIKKI